MASEILERDMYNGRFHMVHNPNAKGRSPRYTVTDIQTGTVTKPKGVTTILGQVIAKDFVGWALDCMADALQNKLPIVTKEDIDDAKLESSRRRDSGASTGTDAHALVEHYLKGDKVDLSGASQEAKNAYQAFVKWFEEIKPEVINVEEVIYSAEFDYPGTYDCMLRVGELVYLCDLKTTNTSRKAPNGVYAENFLQLGAYAAAHEEQREYEEANGGTKLMKIDGLMVISAKKNGVLNIVTEEEVGLVLQDCQTMWKRVVNLFQFLNFTTKALGGK